MSGYPLTCADTVRPTGCPVALRVRCPDMSAPRIRAPPDADVL